jgi:hypothetical protein
MVRQPRSGVEPTRGYSLRWGTYASRYTIGLGLILGGALGLQSANTWTMFMLGFGNLFHVMGWLIMPAGGMRRVWVAIPSLIGVWVLLTGPQSLPGLLLSYIAWLVVRERPAISYLTLLPVAAVTFLMANTFREYPDMALALGITSVVIVGSAWLARWMAGIGRIPSQLQAPAE